MNKNLNICLVSDFFLPQVGGVEVHIYELAKGNMDLMQSYFPEDTK
jgi:hypothetical protein